jgi:hypothetical protein
MAVFTNLNDYAKPEDSGISISEPYSEQDTCLQYPLIGVSQRGERKRQKAERRTQHAPAPTTPLRLWSTIREKSRLTRTTRCLLGDCTLYSHSMDELHPQALPH